MTAQCYDSGINPSAIPGQNLDPDAVETAASTLSTKGGNIRDHGADIVTAWRVLSEHYEAPESADLLTVMDPVETDTLAFGDALESVATALNTFADDIRPIKTALDAVRLDAVTFREDIAGDPEWEYDQGHVDRNTELVGKVNAQQVLLWEAERTCANTIRALYGAEPWHAMTGEDDPLGYGVDELGTDAAMPWGSEVERRDKCPKSAAVQTKRFVWDGIIVDGIWGTVEGLGMLVGIDGDWPKWDVFSSTWNSIGSLVGLGDTPPGEAWAGLGKGMIMWDEWADGNYAQAAGGTIFNVATFFIPGGAAVSGIKGGAAAGKGGKVATALTRAANILDFVDPIGLTLKGGKLAAPTVRTLFNSTLDGLRGIELPDFRPRTNLPDADLPNYDAPGANNPPVRDPDTQPVREQPPVEAPEPARVGSNTPANEIPSGSGTQPSGSQPASQVGGTGSGPDGFTEGPGSPGQSTGGQTTGGGTDAPTGGSSSGNGGGTSSGGDGTPTGNGGSGAGNGNTGGSSTGGSGTGGTNPGTSIVDEIADGGPNPGGNNTPGETGGSNSGDTGGTNSGDTGGSNAGETGGSNAGETGGSNSGDTGGSGSGETGGSNGSGTGGTNPGTSIVDEIADGGPNPGGNNTPGETGGANSGETGGSNGSGTGGTNPGTSIVDEIADGGPNPGGNNTPGETGGSNSGETGGSNSGETGGSNSGETGGSNSGETGGSNAGETGGSGSGTGGTNPGTSIVDEIADGGPNPGGNNTPGETGGTNSGDTGGSNAGETGGSGSGNTGGSNPGGNLVDDAAQGGTNPRPDGDGPAGTPVDPPGPGRVVIDDAGQPHVVNTRDDLLGGQPRYQDALAAELAARGMTETQLTRLVDTPLENLTRQEVTTLVQIRDALPPIGAGDVLQKIVTPDDARLILGDDMVNFAEQGLFNRTNVNPAGSFDSIGGFVARAADVLDLSPSEIFDQLGLNYKDSPFIQNGESMFAVRYQAGDGLTMSDTGLPGPRLDPSVPAGPLEAMQHMPQSIYDIADPAARRVAMQDWVKTNYPDAAYAAGRAFDPANPFRGNGFGGSGAHYAPEFTYGPSRVAVPEGAELLRLAPDGTQEVAAVFRDGEWHTVVEQPGPAPR
ncbi:hypothetical protein V2J52_03240 [Georgenia sp. MJ173]|uniref:hypothetical protein n=1 Tax=Georgenia sunbinii TaxID=3117728 RepID=UPI002F263B8F